MRVSLRRCQAEQARRAPSAAPGRHTMQLIARCSRGSVRRSWHILGWAGVCNKCVHRSHAHGMSHPGPAFLGHGRRHARCLVHNRADVFDVRVLCTNATSSLSGCSAVLTLLHRARRRRRTPSSECAHARPSFQEHRPSLYSVDFCIAGVKWQQRKKQPL